MAEIFLARLKGPGAFERPVVLKQMHAHLARDASFVTMFLDEARIVSALRHPNVVQVHDFVHAGRDLVMILEYVEGETLAQIAHAQRGGVRLDRLLAARIVAEACAGLHAAHELRDAQGAPLAVVHRDVSPQNVMVSYEGHVKVLDFGIAKAAAQLTRTETGQVKGKQAYMSPEQCRGEPLDRRSDVFALGVLLFELLAQRRLFPQESPMQIFTAICEGPIPSPREVDFDCPERLDAICRRALARKADDRYATALEMRRELLEAIRDLGGDDVDDQALARWMQRAFATRVQRKRDLLTAAAQPSPFGQTLDAFEAKPLSAPTRRARWPLLVGAAAIVAATAAFLARTRHEAPSPAASAQTAVASTSASAIAASVPAAASSTSAVPTLSSVVAIDVRTTPPGARVSALGKKLGVTPVVVELPRGTERVQLLLVRDGYAPATEDVTPDKDQRLHLQLLPRGSSAHAQKPGQKPQGSASPTPFERFE